MEQESFSVPDSTTTLSIVHWISDDRLHVSILTRTISLIVVNDFNSIILPHSDT